MATAKDFVDRINRIAGVADCLLVRNDGQVISQTVADNEVDSALLQISSGLARDIMTNVGFSHCHYISFNRVNNQTFYIFPIEKYLLGVTQQTDCSVTDMLDQVFRLIGKVSNNSAKAVS
ncbi:MAG: hypothetical protein J7K09_07520 [Desulfuromusa sp.]|nr:hypothetical protein [Desulfuromusa sp.]